MLRTLVLYKFRKIIPKPLALLACFHLGNLLIFIALEIKFSFFGLSFFILRESKLK